MDPQAEQRYIQDKRDSERTLVNMKAEIVKQSQTLKLWADKRKQAHNRKCALKGVWDGSNERCKARKDHVKDLLKQLEKARRDLKKAEKQAIDDKKAYNEAQAEHKKMVTVCKEHQGKVAELRRAAAAFRTSEKARLDKLASMCNVKKPKALPKDHRTKNGVRKAMSQERDPQTANARKQLRRTLTPTLQFVQAPGVAAQSARKASRDPLATPPAGVVYTSSNPVALQQQVRRQFEEYKDKQDGSLVHWA